MNEEEAREIIDNMSEQELNDFIFFALKEVEKENQKLKIELKKKDKMIDEMGEKIFEEGIVWENKEDVKQYYERKVENGKIFK